MIRQLHIRRCSVAAAALLRQHRPWVGQLHSRYARILNIQMPCGQLLTLQGPGPLQAPCAAALIEDIETCTAALSPGDLVVQDDHTLAALRLTAASATLWDGRLRSLSGVTSTTLRNAADQIASWLAQQASQQGISPVLAALHASGSPVLSPLHQRVYRALMPIRSSLDISTASIARMAAQVIGLGEGLTPSGDDLLVGFLAVLHITGQASRFQELPLFIAPYLANTPDLSGAFIRCALAGDFSEPLVTFVHALYCTTSADWTEPAANLARVGHSSGVDAMVGIALASSLLSSASPSHLPLPN